MYTGAGQGLRQGQVVEKWLHGRTMPAVLAIVLCAALAPGASPSVVRTPTGTPDIPMLLDVETQTISPYTTEPPGLVPISIKLTNVGDTAALVPRLDVTIRPSGYADSSLNIAVGAGRNAVVYMGPWVCPAGSEETCTAWITYPADANHSNDTDVVIVNSVWQRTYDGGHGSDEGRSVIRSTDYSGYIVAGWTHTDAADIDVHLVRTNGQGDTLWTRTYGGPSYDVGNSVQQTRDRGYIIVGSTGSFGAGDEDVYLIRTDSLGDTLWTRAYGGTGEDQGNSVQETYDSGYIVVGTTHSFGAGVADVWLLRTNASGDTLWTRTYGGPLWDRGEAVQQTFDGGFIIAGGTQSFGAGFEDVYTIKTDSLGDTLWTKTFGGPDYDFALSVSQSLLDAGYIVAGVTGGSSGTGKSDGADAYLVKTDSSGDTLWTRTYGGTNYEAANSVQQTDDGRFTVGGLTWSFGAGDCDVYLIETDPSGDTLWTRTYGGTGSDECYSVQPVIDGSYVIAGCTGSFGAGDSDVYLIKTRGLLDVGPVAILSLPGVVDSGTVHVPRAVVGNLGLTSGILSVTMTIGPDYSRTVQETLSSVSQDTFAFPPWTAGPTGTLAVNCFTSLTGDQNPTNDTIRDSVRVLHVRLNDAATTTILSPPGIAESGRVYMPSVVVRNFGLTQATFPVTMDIGSGYSQTTQETIASGLSDTVEFPSWTATPLGPLAVTCFTSLLGDEDPSNDTIQASIQVVPPPRHDVGATAILSPSGSVRAGETVMPRARLKNFGTAVERYFNVRFRIGASYDHTANAAQMLYPDSTVELTFAPWVADSGNWAVSCSTMLVSDVDRANDKVSSSVQVFAQSLLIEPDQTDRIEAGKNKTYQFYALIQGDTGGIVEVAQPSAPIGWSLSLGNATGADDLTDTDGDGIPDLGYVAPGESGRFSLDVTAPSELLGDTASIDQRTILVAGYVGGYPLVADTAVLSLTLMPTFAVHNFPNPFSDHTAFVIGLPGDGKASLTVYTRAGERVCRVLENTDLPAGVHVVRWAGVNDNGRSIAPGTYEYLLDYMHAGKTDRIRKRLVLTRQ